MVDEELAVIHALEDFDTGLRTEGKEMAHLRLGDEGFFGAVPEMDVGAMNSIQAVGIDRLVAVHHRLCSAEGPDFLTLVQQHIEIVRTEGRSRTTRPTRE